MLPNINEFIDDNFNKDPYFGKLFEYSYFARSEGECGDDMSFYISVEDDIITDTKYYTEKGCAHTRLAGKSVAMNAKGKNIYEALCITPMNVINTEKSLAKSGQHCAILAVTTFYNAISNYLLDKD